MAEYVVERSITVASDPAPVHALINDFHEWTAWSPWEDIDPHLDRSYSGADEGVGAHYSWSGNKKAGQGSMEIVSSEPDAIGVRLEFHKPFKATNNVTFTLAPVVDGTEVTWTMSGVQTGLMALIGKVVPMDKFAGKDFEKGLSRLKVAAESR